MATTPVTAEQEPDVMDATEDAHEHGVVLHQVEDQMPLRVEDLDDEDPS